MSKTEKTADVKETVEATVVAPSRSLATLMADHMEKLTAIQLETTRVITEASMEQVRAAMAIGDKEGMQNYVETQSRVAKQVGERLRNDAEAVANLTKATTDEASKVTSTAANKVAESAPTAQ